MRNEITQSRQEQKEYLKHVELKRVLDKRVEKKRKRAEELGQEIPDNPLRPTPVVTAEQDSENRSNPKKKRREKVADADSHPSRELEDVLANVF